MNGSYSVNIDDSFGYYSFQDVEKSCKRYALMFNTANAAGYIPLIGIITGIARGVFFARLLYVNSKNFSESEKRFCRLQILRAGIEICGFGLMFLALDVRVTIERIQVRKASAVQSDAVPAKKGFHAVENTNHSTNQANLIEDWFTPQISEPFDPQSFMFTEREKMKINGCTGYEPIDK